MSAFVAVAAMMAALAAAAVGIPLLRNRGSRAVGVVASVVVMGAAAALYPLWSNFNWRAPASGQSGAPDVEAMVKRLEARMRATPDDRKGWLMLGRSYLALERLDDAVAAYEHARSLDQQDAEAALGLGEAMSLRAGGNITPTAAQLFETAVRLSPENPKALLYAGFAAAARGDSATARARWEALKDMHPPEQIEKMLDARIAELAPSPVAPPAVAASGASAAPVALLATSSAQPAEATVIIKIAPALAARLTKETPLFVFAREPGGAGPPLAAKRLTSASIGSQIQLSDADSMVPGRALVKGQKVSITARVSFSGQPLPAAGDLYGEVTYDVGHDGTRDLIIDRIAD